MNPEYIFKDINKEKINVLFDKKKFQLEGQKLYLLEGFLINKDKELIQLPNSWISEINESLDKNISESKINHLFNFMGKIEYFNFRNKKINVINEEDKNIYEIELNYELLSKISINDTCKFFRFSKIDKNSYKFNNFSDIQYKRKTSITLNFLDYDVKYYNIIKCDKITKEIQTNNLFFEFDEDNYKSIDIKTLIYERVINNKVEYSSKFNLEINVGKNNNFDSLLKKTEGYSYQIYCESNNRNLLPEEYRIVDVDGKIIKIKPERNENELNERFSIINVPFQNIKEIHEKNLSSFSLNPENKNDIEKSLKYLFLINENKKEMCKFFLEQTEKCKDFYNTYKFYEKDLQNFFQKYFIKDIAILYRDIKLIQSQEKDSSIRNLFNQTIIETKLYDVIENGFNKYIFSNCKKDYELIKYICFALLSFKVKITDSLNFNLIITNLKSVLEHLNMEYIDNIKALITFTRENINNDMIYYKLSIIKLNNKNKKYIYYNEGMKIFWNIINDLTENSAFYKGIRQFNGLILKDEITQKKMYSGNNLNLKDIQIELMKYPGKFCFIQENYKGLYGAYWSCSGTMILNPDNFLGHYCKNKELNDNIVKRATSCILFILFHEIAGHCKTHINNETDSPNQVYIIDTLKLININEADSGHLFEFILTDYYVNCKYFINSEISAELLDENLYLGSDFNELKEKLQKINPGFSQTIQSGSNIKGKKAKIIDDETIEEINLNYYNMTFTDLLIFFSNLDEEKKNEMKNTDAYKYYLSFKTSDKKI